MKPEIVSAQLSIIDGAWQEAPDNLACFDAAALFDGSLERGDLYIVLEVAGEAEGRDELARELIETARRAYAASRGSIALGLMEAVRAANDYFYNVNANTPPAARRIAGMTAAVLREDELFIAQGGPGVTCLTRANVLTRYPVGSPWFNADDAAVTEWLSARNFDTPGQVPMGMRRNYEPDVYHVTLHPGDVIVLATRALTHLLTEAEMVDSLANRHPDEIIAGLEDLAGAADISVIVLRVAGEAAAPTPALSEVTPSARPQVETEQAAETIETTAPHATAAPPQPTEEELALRRLRTEREQERRRVQEEQARERKRKIRSGFLRAGAGVMGALAGITGRINWTSIGNAADRAIGTALRGITRLIVFLIRAITPGAPSEDHPARKPSPALQTAWKLAALALPVLLVVAGVARWGIYRADLSAARERQITQLVADSGKALEDAKRLERTDRQAARDAAQNALKLAEQARALSPQDPRVSNAYYSAQDSLDALSGVSVIYSLPTFATFADPKSKLTRIVARGSDVFILDRGLQRVYRYAVNEAGSGAAPASSDGIILKFGDRIDNRTVGDLFDVLWLDAGRLAALDRSGAYYQYDPAKQSDPAKPVWSARVVNDPAAWGRATMAATYANNLYLVDSPRNQILKYVTPSAEVVWTSAVTYFAPGVTPPDLSTAADLAIDGDVWIVRSDGSVSRYNQGRPNDLTFTGLDAPISKPVAIFTSEKVSSVYLADAGNQRIVQFDKVTGRFTRQFKPRGLDRDAFKALQVLAVDEPSKRFLFVSAGKAYLATIPQ